jgi:hypothetical protein
LRLEFMTTSACPKCHDEVTLPPGAPRAAQVRCPWCREEFELSELLDRMPPMLEIVSTPYTTTEERRDFPTEGAEEDFQLAATDNGRSSPGSFDFSGGGAATAAPTVAPRPRTAKTTAAARPRRKEKSAVAEIIKVVLGGLVGLVLAQLILWWLPEPYKRDPVELGPMIGKYVPWIVPAEFRPRSSSAGGEESDGSSRTPESTAGGEQLAGAQNSRAARNTSGGRSSGPAGGPPARRTTLPPLTNGEPLKEEEPLNQTPAAGADSAAIPSDPLEIPEPNLSLTPGSERSLDPLTPPSPTSTPSEPVGTAPEETKSPEPAKNPEAATSAPPAAASETTEPIEPAPSALQKSNTPADADVFVGVTDAPMYVKNEIDGALAEAEAAQKALESSDAATASQAEEQLYSALTELAEKLTYADVNDPKIEEAANQAKSLLTQGNLRERAKLLMTHGPARLSAKKDERSNGGIVLFGRVESTEKTGPLYETRLEMPGQAIVPLFSKTDPQLDPGATVIVLGTLVDEPRKRLAGYEGGLPTAVWMSHAAPLTK